MEITRRLADAPLPVKVGGIAIAGVTLAGVLRIFNHWDPWVLVIVGLGLLLICLLLLGLYLLRRHRNKAIGREIARKMPGGVPAQIKKAEQLARLDALRRAFEDGVRKFREAGRNLYSTPWYVLVGESGGGKTEAIRHSRVPLFPGLQDPLQGVGGTINMNWWFTKHAIVLDTAGRKFFEEVEPGTTSEWDGFLDLLKTHRANCPINGLLLMIPANTLLSDSADEVDQKAQKIASQFEKLQLNLGIRFPVFVVITKCDLIAGFNEFFDSLADPEQQSQILGWSNPAGLDSEFDPKLVDDYLQKVRSSLLRRRLRLLAQPMSAEEESARRLDQLDALYGLPDNLLRLGPRLKHYLDTIFVAGQWSQKPLFLRGIYFTCSMQQGSPLDPDLATALGVGISQLPKDRDWDRKRSYFLRDLFMEKVFPEKGLVTRVVNVASDQRRKKVITLGLGFAAVAVLLGLSVCFAVKLSNDLGDDTRLYGEIDKEWLCTTAPPALVSGGQYHGEVHAKLEESQKRQEKKIQVGLLFSWVPRLGMGKVQELNELREKAHQRLVEAVALAPLLNATRQEIANPPPEWLAADTAALQRLIDVHYGPITPAQWSDLLEYAVQPDPKKPQAQPAKFTLRVPAASVASNISKVSTHAIQQGVKALEDGCKGAAERATEDRKGAEAFLAAHSTLLEKYSALVALTTEPAKPDEYTSRRELWKEKLDPAKAQSNAVDETLPKVWKDNDFIWKSVDDEDKLITALNSLGYSTTQPAQLHQVAPSRLAADLAFKREHDALANQARILAGRLAERDRSRKKLEEKRASLGAPDEKLKTALGALNKLFPPNPLGLPVHHYRVPLFLFESAEQRLVEAQDPWSYDKTDAGIFGLTKLVEKRKTRVTSISEPLGGVRAAAPDLSTYVNATEYVMSSLAPAIEGVPSEAGKAIANLAGAAAPDEKAVAIQRGTIAPPVFATLPTTKEGWEKLIAQQSPDSGRRKISIPLTVLNQMDVVLAKYDPYWVNKLREALDQLKSAAGLKKDQKTALNDYISDYAGYWNSGVYGKLDYATKNAGTWQGFRAKLNEVNVNDICSGLKNFGQQLAEARAIGKALAKALGQEPDSRQDDTLAECIRKLEGDSYAGECKAAVEKWWKLSFEASEARATLLATPSIDFKRDYMVSCDDYLHRYWRQLPKTAIGRVSDSFQGEIKDNYRKLKALGGFPIMPVAAELPFLKLREAREIIKLLPRGASFESGSLGNPDSKDQAAVAAVTAINNLCKNELDELRRAGTLGQAEQDWIKWVARLLDALPEEAKDITCTITLTKNGLHRQRLRMFDGDQGQLVCQLIEGQTSPELSLYGSPLIFKSGAFDENIAGDQPQEVARFGGGAAGWRILRAMYDCPDTFKITSIKRENDRYGCELVISVIDKAVKEKRELVLTINIKAGKANAQLPGSMPPLPAE